MMKTNNNHRLSNGGDLDLPQGLVSLLPEDPYEQLDVARRITALAIGGRVYKLEAEAGRLRQKVGEKEELISGLQQRIVDVERNLQETTAHLSHALDEQVTRVITLFIFSHGS
ncbi:hypothetical protein O6H91_16G066900 [Diphasiastrum complanatum]|uniref:Uncharacterized protein n=1 Tax=Diphasiastrum complanatum TaxID=34168 RepID=A0ACC2BE40_DIPCM|nr:hypothetical protein O6H91_16G066900 [Diphasiastrum complanatum]